MDKATVESVMALAFELARIREQHGAQSGMYLSEVRALRAEAERLAAQAAPTEPGGDVEPVAWRFRWNQQGDWHITSHEPRGGDGTNKEPLYSASTVAALKAERDAALARVAVLEKDAARYRWLRQEHERFDPICHLTWKAGGNRNSSEWVNTAVLDSSIDAALTKGQP